MAFTTTPPQHKKTAAPAGPVSTAQKLFAFSTAGSTQDVTISGVTATPVAAKVVYSTNININTVANQLSLLGAGFASSTNNVAHAAIHDRVRPTFSARMMSDTYALISPDITDPGYDTPIFEGVIGFITGGIRISWNSIPVHPFPCLLEIYWGSDVSADVGIHNMGNSTAPTTLSLTNCDPSSENCLLQMSTGGQPLGQPALTIGLFGFGAATNDGGISQGMSLNYSDVELSTSDCQNYPSGSGVIGQIFRSLLSWKAEVTDFSSANQIEFTTNIGAGDDQVIYMCLGVGSKGVHVSVENSPITTGTWGPSPGWTAQSACIMASKGGIFDSLDGGIQTTFFQAASNTEDSSGASVGIAIRNATTLTDIYCSQAESFTYYNDSGTSTLVAYADTLAPNSWIDVTSESIVTSQKWLCWAIEA